MLLQLHKSSMRCVPQRCGTQSVNPLIFARFLLIQYKNKYRLNDKFFNRYKMKVSALLKTHKKFQQKGLTGNFGDGYLIEHNRVYCQIRKAALAAGYKFSTERDETYEVFPLLQLERLLKNKVFPYSNNVQVFEDLSSQQLEVLDWEDLIGNLKRNFVFHEGSHAVIRDLLAQHFGKAQHSKEIEGTDTLASQRVFVLRVLLEESFANTAELLGVIDADDSIHQAFYELNSYNTLFEHRSNLKKALNELGANLLIPFFILSYLHVNFLRESLTDSDLKKIVATIGHEPVKPTQMKTLKAMSKLCFELSEIFRYQTTSFHLKINGINTPLEEVLDFDFLEELKQQCDLPALLSRAQFLLKP